MLASGIEWFILPVMPAAEFKLYGCATNGVQAVAACSEHEFDRHSHDQFGIGLITAGAKRWHSDRRQVEAHSGKVIAVNAG